jgi:hypothetical protein
MGTMEYLVWIRRRVGETALDFEYTFQADDTEELRKQVDEYFKNFWFSGTVRERFGLYWKADRTEAIEVKGWRELLTQVIDDQLQR